jgi:hypothetical protein
MPPLHTNAIHKYGTVYRLTVLFPSSSLEFLCELLNMTKALGDNAAGQVGESDDEISGDIGDTGDQEDTANSVALPTVRRPRETALNEDQRRNMQRILSNRNSARLSYLRRKEATSLLRSKADELSQKSVNLMAENESLRRQVQELRQQVALLVRNAMQSYNLPTTLPSHSAIHHPRLPGASMLSPFEVQLLRERTINQNRSSVASYFQGASTFLPPDTISSHTPGLQLSDAASQQVARARMDLETLLRLHPPQHPPHDQA